MTIFAGLPQQIEVARYHSLVVDDDVPDVLVNKRLLQLDLEAVGDCLGVFLGDGEAAAHG